MRHWVTGAVLLAAFVAFVGSAYGREDPPKKLTDAEITKLLVGKWAVEVGGEKGPKLKGTNHYKKDGTFDAEGTVEIGDKSLKIDLSGTWKVSDGMIIAAVTKTNIPEVIKEGHVSKDQVLIIDDKVLKYKVESGKESIRRRIKE